MLKKKTKKMKRSAILTKIKKLNVFTDQEEEKIQYAWLSIRNDLFKITILWIGAALLGFSIQFIVVSYTYSGVGYSFTYSE